MAPVKVAVNGCGRIGRLAIRLLFDQADTFELVHVNDLAAVESVAYLLKYDSVHRTWAHGASPGEGCIVLRNSTSGVAKSVAFSAVPSPAGLVSAYTALGVQIVLECTGAFLTHATLAPYFEAGVKHVVVSAPVKDKPEVLNIVMGVNDGLFNPSVDKIVTAASCTTNCLAPVVKVIHEQLVIKHGCITTVHNLTNTQTIVDAPNAKKADLRRARSGLVNLAPTSTGSATAIALIFPELKGKLNGLAIRVPLTNSSITDCVFEVSRPTTAEEVNGFLKSASETYLKGILGFETLPLVSTDYVDDPRSGIVDAECTQVIDGTMVKLYVWYDNEYGYSCRLVDLAKLVASKMTA